MEEKKVLLKEKETEKEENLIIRFGKTYLFEGKEYKEVDLSGMEDMTGEDMIAVNKMMGRSGIGVSTEVTLEYACYFAGRAAELPVEFFLKLPAREAVKVKNRVIDFLFGAD